MIKELTSYLGGVGVFVAMSLLGSHILKIHSYELIMVWGAVTCWVVGRVIKWLEAPKQRKV